MIGLDDLKTRCDRIAEERARLETRLASLTQHQQEQARHASLTVSLEEFCRNSRTALQNPSFETKQRILRLVVDRIEVTDEQIMIKHMIPLSDVRLQRHHYSRKSLPKMRICPACSALHRFRTEQIVRLNRATFLGCVHVPLFSIGLDWSYALNRQEVHGLGCSMLADPFSVIRLSLCP